MKKTLLFLMLLASAPTFAMEVLELPSEEELAKQFAHVGKIFGLDVGDVDRQAQLSKTLGGKKLLSLGVGNEVMKHLMDFSYPDEIVQGLQNQVYETLFKNNSDALNELQEEGFYNPEEDFVVIAMPSEQELGKILGCDDVITKSKIASILAGKELHPLGVDVLVEKTLTSWAEEVSGNKNNHLLVSMAKENVRNSFALGAPSGLQSHFLNDWYLLNCKN